ncbi:uncharacterized protein LOC100373105 [Saccoglossus kowalevskii]|uniref:Uncharacterized protein LOC100373105 n=1 Tax=Saccoglossus kowalevskii TaxID=10224 RepID=A0ABM0GL83_SACKO|nr:PREDICTED: uncharacterized protein LOC100373105 [Saccoglossus kowalevskii]
MKLYLLPLVFMILLLFVLRDLVNADDEAVFGNAADDEMMQEKRYKWVVPGMGSNTASNKGSGRKRSDAEDDAQQFFSALHKPLLERVQQCRTLIADYEELLSSIGGQMKNNRKCGGWKSGWLANC